MITFFSNFRCYSSDVRDRSKVERCRKSSWILDFTSVNSNLLAVDRQKCHRGLLM